VSKLFSSRFFWPSVIVVAVVALYLPALGSELIFDDERLLDGSIFGAYGNAIELKQRMLSYGSFVWVQAFLGEGWWKQYLVNVMIHAATTVLQFQWLFLLLSRAGLPERDDGSALDERSLLAISSLGTLLFALNPVSVYAVAYLVQRSVLMATFFSVACLLATLQAARAQRPLLLLVATLAYVLALLSKEHAVMLPVVALALYLVERRPSKATAMLTLTGVLAVTTIGAAFLIHRYESTGLLGQTFDLFGKRYVEQLTAMDQGFPDRAYLLSVINQMWLFLKYGAFWFVPNVLWMSLDLRPVFPLSLVSFPHFLGIPIYLGVIASSVYLMARSPGWLRLVGFALFAPAILFASEFATVWIQDPFVLYRSYLWAAVGFPLLVALLFASLPFRHLLFAIALASVVFGGLSVERVLSLKTPAAAWHDAAAKVDPGAPANAVGRWRPLVNSGNQYLQRGLLSPALAQYTMASRLGETSGLADYHRGLALEQLGQTTEALQAYEAAEKSKSKNPFAHLVPLRKAAVQFQKGMFADAEATADRAVAVLADREDRVAALNLRAKSRLKLGKFGDAAADLRTALQLDSTNRSAGIELGIVLGLDGKPDDGLVAVAPWMAAKDGADVRFARAMIFMKNGKPAEALAESQRALQFKPEDPALQGLVRKLQSGG
jgi:tetratricopeptide (TPR) repeat protein